MKKALSLFLSLALLATVLIIPMTTSAVTTGDGVTTTEFSQSEIGNYYTADDPTRISDGLMPIIHQTENGYRNDISKNAYSNSVNCLTDGVTNTTNDVYCINFAPNGSYVNGYDRNSAWTEPAGGITKYVDVIFDLGEVTTINKIQQISGDHDHVAGLYRVYTATDMSGLFSGAPLLTYQNMTGGTLGSQQHVFPDTQARFVAFRMIAPSIENSWVDCLRISELAIYGTPVGYNVNSIAYSYCKDNALNIASTQPAGTIELLKNSTLKFVSEEDGVNRDWGDFDLFGGGRAAVHDGAYGKCTPTHADIYYGVENNYAVTENSNGNVTVTNSGNNALRMTFDLGGSYLIKQFGFASSVENGDFNALAYEVYIGTDEENLYSSGNLVHSYVNYFGTNTQIFNFSETHVGSYIGIRILDAGKYDGTTRPAEIWAYGIDIGTPPVIRGVTEGKTYCASVTLTIIDFEENIATVTVNGEDRTSSLTEDGKLTITGADNYKVVVTDDMNNKSEVNFTIDNHDLQYVASGAVITETCSKCAHEETLTLKVDGDEIVYDGNDKSTSIIAETTKGFVGWKGVIDFEQNGAPATEVILAGDYVAKATIEDATAVLNFTVEKMDDPTYVKPNDFTGIEAGKELSTITLPEKFSWKNPSEKIGYGEGEYEAIYDPQNENYRTKEINIKVTAIDTTAPTGEIKIKEKTWLKKLVDIAFGWFIKEKETVTITDSDTGSGVKAVYYYVADAEVDEIGNIEWTEYKKAFKIEKEGNNVVYAKIEDVAGNVTVINTEGIVLDTIVPIADVTDMGTYYGSIIVTVTEDNVDTVKINGEEVTVTDGKFTVLAADGAQKIVITDKAGNTATYTVTVVEVKGFDPAQEGNIRLTVDMDEKNVDNAGKEKIAEKIEKGETVTFFDISVDNATGATNNVLEVPVDFNFTGKLNVRVLHKHGGNVNELKALTARPTADFENGTFFADKENGKLYIYSKEFSPFAVAFHVHDVKHVEAKAATAEADGNIEYWYCEGCDKYFSDAAATKEIAKADTVVKYAVDNGGNTTDAGTQAPGGTSPVTGQTAMTIVLFTILLGALAIMGVSIAKTRKAKSK